MICFLNDRPNCKRFLEYTEDGQIHLLNHNPLSHGLMPAETKMHRIVAVVPTEAEG